MNNRTVREDIIKATARLVQEHGYNRVTTAMIVAESDTSKGALYHYFPKGKPQIVAEATRRTQRNVEIGLRRTLESADTLLDGLRQQVDRMVESMEAQEKENHVIHNNLSVLSIEAASIEPEIASLCAESYDGLQRAFADAARSHGYTDEEAQKIGVLCQVSFGGAIVEAFARNSPSILRQTLDALALVLRKE